jgi:hypothetical protein
MGERHNGTEARCSPTTDRVGHQSRRGAVKLIKGAGEYSLVRCRTRSTWSPGRVRPEIIQRRDKIERPVRAHTPSRGTFHEVGRMATANDDV